MVLKSLRFCSEGEVDAYHFPQEEKSSFITWRFSKELEEEEYGEGDNGSTILSQELTPLLGRSVPEFEDEDDIHAITSQNDPLESEVEAVHRRKPEQWIDYSESDDIEVCKQSVSDVDDEASSPEPQELSTIYEGKEEFKNGEQNDEPLEIDSPEPQKLSSLHESHPELDNYQDGEPLEADSPEPRRLSTLHHFDPAEYDDDTQDDESIGSNSPEPRRLFPFHHLEFDPPQPSAPGMRSFFCPGPMKRFLTPDSILKLEAFDEWFVRMSESISFVNAAASFNPEGCVSETPSPEPRRIFHLHLFHSTVYEPKPTPETETEIQPVIFCPKPIRQYPTHNVILQPKLFEDWFVDMSEPVFIDDAAMSPEQQQSISPETPRARPGAQTIFPVAVESCRPDFDNDEKDDDESIEADSPEPGGRFPVHQSHSSLQDTRQAVSKLDDEEAFETMEFISLESLNLGF